MPAPCFISVEPTNFCNLKCPACPSGSGELTRVRGYINFDLYRKIINEQKEHLISLILHFQGEPLLYKQLDKVIEYARINKIHTMFSTNGQLLYKCIDKIAASKPDRIIISLDGLSQETYNKYRVNGDINKVYKSLKEISKLKKNNRPYIELQFIVFEHNMHELKLLKNLKKEFKIDKIKIKSAQIYNNEQIPLLPNNEKYLRYKISNNNFILKSKLSNKCKRIVFGSVITWDGSVVPCCFDKNALYKMGDISKKSLNLIRNSMNYKLFVNSVFSERKNIDICKNCTEGIKNV